MKNRFSKISLINLMKWSSRSSDFNFWGERERGGEGETDMELASTDGTSLMNVKNVVRMLSSN